MLFSSTSPFFLYKVDTPSLIAYHYAHLYLSGVWFGVLPRMKIQGDVYLERDWMRCSDYGNHSRFVAQ